MALCEFGRVGEGMVWYSERAEMGKSWVGVGWLSRGNELEWISKEMRVY